MKRDLWPRSRKTNQASGTNALASCLLVLTILGGGALSASPQQAAEKDLEHSRSYGIKMLKVVKEQIEKNYYDPRFHGLDLDARFKRAEEQIKQATSDGQVIGVIAQAVLDLNDSHTRLVPPLRKVVAVYGWRMQMIGDICYVTAVKPGSDAELKGLKAGDRILALDGIEPTREILWKMKYLYYSLRPKSRIQITFQAPESQVRTVEVLPKLEQRRIEAEFGRIVDVEPISPELGSIPPRRPQYQEFGADLIVWSDGKFAGGGELAKAELDQNVQTWLGEDPDTVQLKQWTAEALASGEIIPLSLAKAIMAWKPPAQAAA